MCGRQAWAYRVGTAAPQRRAMWAFCGRGGPSASHRAITGRAADSRRVPACPSCPPARRGSRRRPRPRSRPWPPPSAARDGADPGGLGRPHGAVRRRFGLELHPRRVPARPGRLIRAPWRCPWLLSRMLLAAAPRSFCAPLSVPRATSSTLQVVRSLTSVRGRGARRARRSAGRWPRGERRGRWTTGRGRPRCCRRTEPPP